MPLLEKVNEHETQASKQQLTESIKQRKRSGAHGIKNGVAGMKKQSRSLQVESNFEGESVSVLKRDFIIENFVWEGTRVTLKCDNLNNLCIFFDQKPTAIIYLLKFITWIGDLRPITLHPSLIQYEQCTLHKIISLIDFRRILSEFAQLLLHYPLQELYHLLFLGGKLLGLNDIDDKESGYEQLNTIKKVVSASYQMVRGVILSSNRPSTDHNENYRLEYMRALREQNALRPASSNARVTQEVIERILNFKYSEWDYNNLSPSKKVDVRVSRLERYSGASCLLPYDWMNSRIKMAIDSHIRNKIYRQITNALLINDRCILGTTDEW